LSVLELLRDAARAFADWYRRANSRSDGVAEWRYAISGRGFVELQPNRPHFARLVAEHDWLHVQFTGEASSERFATHIVLELLRGPGHLGVRRETMWTALEKRRGAREIEVGDPRFDDLFFVTGAPPLVLAQLDAEVRHALAARAGEVDFELTNNRMTVHLPGAYQPQLRSVFGRLLDLARLLARPCPLPDRLIELLRTDPVVGVRVSAVRELEQDYAHHPEALAALRHATGDLTPEVRLRAASALGEEGRPVLAQLAEDPDVADEIAAAAVYDLSRSLAPDDSLRILKNALRGRRIETAASAIGALAKTPAAVAVPTLARVVEIEHGRLAAQAARALGHAGGDVAEHALLDALRRNREADVRLAAVQALGAFCSVACVLPLQEAGARHAGDVELARAVRQAVAEIQSRQPGAGPGQLSLAENSVGHVSLAADVGRLSLSDGNDDSKETALRKT
jgi:HEAT repeat protein